jgi:membrane protein implicated in regulation of membrane protease activity
MKKPWLAFLLSFLIVGAGFAYLGKWGLAVANFLAAIIIGVCLAVFSPNSLSWAAIAIPAISAVLAMNAAKAMNQKTQLQPASSQP